MDADTTSPTVVISSDASAPVTGPFAITIAFSESVIGFDLADLVVGNGIEIVIESRVPRRHASAAPGFFWSPRAARSVGTRCWWAGRLASARLSRSLGRALWRCWRDRASSRSVPVCAEPLAAARSGATLGLEARP